MMSFMGYWPRESTAKARWTAPLAPMPSASLTRRGPAVALALLIVAVAVGTLVYPTYPNYDLYYSLLWGRGILHMPLPLFDNYPATTENPLSLAFGAALSLLGRS